MSEQAVEITVQGILLYAAEHIEAADKTIAELVNLIATVPKLAEGLSEALPDGTSLEDVKAQLADLPHPIVGLLRELAENA